MTAAMRRHLAGIVTTRYQELMAHCLSCTQCRADTETSCSIGRRLRHAWSEARKGVSPR